MAYAKANPGKLSYAAGTVGTSPHLTMEWLKLRLKFDIVHIPYKNASQGTSDVMAGQLPINITNMPFVIAPIQSGRLRALAVASAKRQALLPDVPTMQESGVPDFEVNSWYGVCAPAGVPAALLDKLNADMHLGIAHARSRAAPDRAGDAARADHPRRVRPVHPRGDRALGAGDQGRADSQAVAKGVTGDG